MKKLKLNLSHLKGGEMLSREQMKNLMGGDSGSSGQANPAPCTDSKCTMSIQGSDGSWVTRSGNCAFSSIIQNTCYCDVGLGVTPVTSNSGVSRCDPR